MVLLLLMVDQLMAVHMAVHMEVARTEEACTEGHHMGVLMVEVMVVVLGIKGSNTKIDI